MKTSHIVTFKLTPLDSYMVKGRVDQLIGSLDKCMRLAKSDSLEAITNDSTRIPVELRALGRLSQKDIRANIRSVFKKNEFKIARIFVKESPRA